MNKSVLLLSLLLAACGGGGGGGGSTDSGAETGPFGSGNSVASSCSLSQTISSVARNDGLRIAKVSYLQVAEQDAASSSARLASNKTLRLRVDVLANNAQAKPSKMQVIGYSPATQSCTAYTLSGPSTIPTTTDLTTLNTAYTAVIPASAVLPGMSLAVLLDDAAGRTTTEAQQTLKTFSPTVLTGRVETVRVIPLEYQGDLGYAPTALVENVIERTYGLSNVVARTEQPFRPPSFDSTGGLLGTLGLVDRFNAQTMRDVLAEVDDECRRLNGAQSSAVAAPKCLGVFPDNINFSSSSLLNSGSSIVGIAYIGGITMVTQSFSAVDESTVSSPYVSSHWLNFRAVTVAHEFGHLMNLRHANCGVAGDEPRLYPDGRIGSQGAGYDEGRGFYFSATRLLSGQQQFGDLMSYCQKEWPSDLGYVLSLAYRAAGASSSAARLDGAAVSEQWLRLRLLPNDQWQVRSVDFAPSHLVDTGMRLQLLNVVGQPKLMLRSAEVSDMPEAATSGPYFVSIPDAGVAIDELSWQILGDNNEILRAGVGQVLSPR